MKTITLSSLELAKAAVADAANFKLSASFKEDGGKYIVSFEKSKADMYGDGGGDGGEEDDKCGMCYEDVCSLVTYYLLDYEYSLKWLREDVNWLTSRFNDHMQGHLPAIKDAGKMAKAVETLGMSDSVEVVKQRVVVEW